jgi:8-oxo-dGTP diphosphatase
MEAAGVAQAAHLNRSLPVVVVRGISDRADGAKTAADAARWQPRAAAHAAAFATALAQELTTEGATDQTAVVRAAAGKGGSGSMGMTNSNFATGNAHVGIQTGQIFGNVTLGSTPQPPVDLAAELVELRGLLKRAHRDGELDEETYSAAETELDAANDCLTEGTPRSRHGLMVALKKLRGLVAEVAELAACLATIIAVVKSLS